MTPAKTRSSMTIPVREFSPARLTSASTARLRTLSATSISSRVNPSARDIESDSPPDIHNHAHMAVAAVQIHRRRRGDARGIEGDARALIGVEQDRGRVLAPFDGSERALIERPPEATSGRAERVAFGRDAH